ncbi:MAG: hypothetical protein ACRERU_16375 [Methylococcales bacterium]
MADHPNSDPIFRSEGEVEESGQVAEQLDAEIVSLVEHPDGKTMLGVGEILDAVLAVAPPWCASQGGFESERPREIALPVEAGEIGIRGIDDAATVRIQFGRNRTQGSGFAETGRCGQQTAAGLFEKPSKGLFQAG